MSRNDEIEAPMCMLIAAGCSEPAKGLSKPSRIALVQCVSKEEVEQIPTDIHSQTLVEGTDGVEKAGLGVGQ